MKPTKQANTNYRNDKSKLDLKGKDKEEYVPFNINFNILWLRKKAQHVIDL